MGPSELAARRVVAVSAAIIALMTAAITWGLLLGDVERGLPGWYLAIGGAASVAFILSGVLAPWFGERMLRTAATMSLAVYVAMILAFPIAALQAGGVDHVPWMLTPSAAAIAAALLVGRLRVAWATLAFATISTLVYRLSIGGLSAETIVNDSQVALTGAVICVICGHVLSISRELDAAASTASCTGAQEAAERARLSARRRAAAVVHDEVLTTLAVAGSGIEVPREALTRQAKTAVGAMAALTHEIHDGRSGLREALADAVAEIRGELDAGRSRVAFEVRADDPGEVPGVAVEALVAATRQALRNSARHAGAGADIRLTLSATPERIEIEVVDDGVGFDRAALRDDRLGVRVSIEQRVRDVPGGYAQVDSRPGAGTRVVLGWQAMGRAEARPSAALAAGDQRALERGLVAIAVIFVAGQAASALAVALAALSVGPAAGSSIGAGWWAPILILLGVLASSEILRFSKTNLPSPARALVFVVSTVATVVIGATLVPFTYADMWFVTAAAFLLVALALRSRAGAALMGLAGLVAVVVVAGIAEGAPLALLANVALRPVVLVVLASALLIAVDRMQHRTRALLARTVDVTRRTAWEAASRAEVEERAAALEERIAPTLRMIARGEPLSIDEQRRCLALDGELRDEYRAGALARSPLVEAVRAARERGVDVVLLDDSDAPIVDTDLDDLAREMTSLLASTRAQFVGRLLPADRGRLATVTVDGRTTDLGG
ncbi:sensor histidine kinase [Microbacterium sp. F2]|uniref:sensor histidine kinase n=1 Tax=Microbacterium sp. F2 TaxID=3422228 RepID=UPI003FD14F96